LAARHAELAGEARALRLWRELVRADLDGLLHVLALVEAGVGVGQAAEHRAGLESSSDGGGGLPGLDSSAGGDGRAGAAATMQHLRTAFAAGAELFQVGASSVAVAHRSAHGAADGARGLRGSASEHDKDDATTHYSYSSFCSAGADSAGADEPTRFERTASPLSATAPSNIGATGGAADSAKGRVDALLRELEARRAEARALLQSMQD
jgi:hypothetical protein